MVDEPKLVLELHDCQVTGFHSLRGCYSGGEKCKLKTAAVSIFSVWRDKGFLLYFRSCFIKKKKKGRRKSRLVLWIARKGYIFFNSQPMFLSDSDLSLVLFWEWVSSLVGFVCLSYNLSVQGDSNPKLLSKNI